MTLFFYLPCIGQGRFIQEQNVRLPEPFQLIEIPFTGYLILLLLSLGLWGVLWFVLEVLEKAGIFSLFKLAPLRNGFLFALHPQTSNNLAVSLASYVVGIDVIRGVLELAKMILGRAALDVAQGAAQVISLLTSVMDLFPGIKDIGLLVLSIFTIIAAYFFKREKGRRESSEIRRNLLIRKKKQREIVVAPGQ
ncbi:MAG: hypothetical protein HY276_09195 [Ignavibacteriales bacterium]|nr:hypothetical protein [Ignavibacteriales bacterium]